MTRLTGYDAEHETIEYFLKNPREAIIRARNLRGAGALDDARAILADTLQAGAWQRTSLWWELVSLMTAHDDYVGIRKLWLLAPNSAHESPSIQRAVARAAAVAGEHHECRLLLRRLISLQFLQNSRRNYRQASNNLVHKLSHTKKQPLVQDDFGARAAVALIDLNKELSALDIRTFLISGTLLGFVREGGIISWDKDIDVGIFTEQCNIDLEKHFSNHPLFRVGKVDLSSERLRLIHSNGMWIDIFPHYLENNLRWHNGTATRWWNTPFDLKKVEFLGIEQHIPENPELYLDENYGDWRTPNSNFDARIDAPNAEISDPEHFLSLLYFSLEKSIREQKSVMKERYLEALRNHNEEHWVSRFP